MAKSKVAWYPVPNRSTDKTLDQNIKTCKLHKLPIRYVRSKNSSGLMYPEVLCSQQAYNELLKECKKEQQ